MIVRKQKVLKVCKIDSIQFASFAIKQNAEFLGIHILEEDNIGEHKELVEFIKANNGKPVIVTKVKNITTLQTVINIYQPSGLQFHFESQPEIAMTIKNLFPTLLLFGVITDQSKFLDFDVINNLFDYVIYDTSYKGGTNKKNHYEHFNKFPKALREKTLLAGGINPERIAELNSLQALGYDIQSYFRTESGLSFKNLDKISDLLKFPRKNMLSVSLTDLPLNEMWHSSSYYLNSNLEYHLDLSLGSLYTSFNTTSNSIEEKQRFLIQLPYSIHLFMRDEDEIRKKIKKLTEKYPLNLVRIFVQYFAGIDKEIFSEKIGGIKIIPSILHKDLNSYLQQSLNSPILSIVVPRLDDKEDIEIFINTFLSHRKNFEEKEIWLDRNLEWSYIELLKRRLDKDFNFIIGKEVINDWSKINFIYEQLLKER